MTNKKNLLILYFLIMIEFIILSKSSIVIKSVINASYMFITKVFPSLFPTMIIGNLLVKNNVWKIIPTFIKNIFKKLFGYNDAMISIFIISMFTGSPSNGMYINEYLEKKIINEKEAETLLCTTHFINPLFVIGGVGKGVFNDAKIGFIILLLLYLSNFIKAFILREKNTNENKTINENNTNIIKDFTNVIKNSLNALLMIFGIIIIFNLLISLITNIFLLNDITSVILNGLLEMTGGVISLETLNINFYLKLLLAYYFLNFGGLCIQMQTLGILQNEKIRYLKYLIFRMF